MYFFLMEIESKMRKALKNRFIYIFPLLIVKLPVEKILQNLYNTVSYSINSTNSIVIII